MMVIGEDDNENVNGDNHDDEDVNNDGGNDSDDHEKPIKHEEKYPNI